MEVAADPQVRANGYVASFEHPSGTEVTAVRTPVRVDGRPHALHSAPEAWAHTEEILLELGHGWDRVAQLKDQGVIP